MEIKLSSLVNSLVWFAAVDSVALLTRSGVIDAMPCTDNTSVDALPAVPIAGCFAADAAPVGSGSEAADTGCVAWKNVPVTATEPSTATGKPCVPSTNCPPNSGAIHKPPNKSVLKGLPVPALVAGGGVTAVVVVLPPPLDPLPPPVPVGKPLPPTMLTVVVLAEVMQDNCVAEPTVKANHPPFGAIYCCAVEDDAPNAQ